MFRISIVVASLALIAATPSFAGEWDGYNAAMQHQYGTYDNYKTYNTYNRPSYGGYSYQDSYAPHRYGYGPKYGYRYVYNYQKWNRY